MTARLIKDNMRKLNKAESVIFIAGGVIMVIAAGCFAFMWQQGVVCWAFVLGALMFSITQARQSYGGKDITIRRLKKIQGLADLLFVLSGVLMIDSAYMFLRPLFPNAAGNGYENYIQYVYNKWVVLLIIACILEVYTVHRLSNELNKHGQGN